MYFSIENSRKVYLLQNWAENQLLLMWFLFEEPSLKHPMGKTTSGFLLPLCLVLWITTEIRSKFISRALRTKEEKKYSLFCLFLPHKVLPSPPKYSLVRDCFQWYWNIWLVWVENRKPLNFLSYLRTMSSFKKKILCGHPDTKEFILFCFLEVVQVCLKGKNKIITFYQMEYHK